MALVMFICFLLQTAPLTDTLKQGLETQGVYLPPSIDAVAGNQARGFIPARIRAHGRHRTGIWPTGLARAGDRCQRDSRTHSTGFPNTRRLRVSRKPHGIYGRRNIRTSRPTMTIHAPIKYCLTIALPVATNRLHWSIHYPTVGVLRIAFIYRSGFQAVPASSERYRRLFRFGLPLPDQHRWLACPRPLSPFLPHREDRLQSFALCCWSLFPSNVLAPDIGHVGNKAARTGPNERSSREAGSAVAFDQARTTWRCLS